MRFWKIDALKHELSAAPLAASQAVQYSIASGVLTILLYGLPFYDANAWDVAGICGDAALLGAGSYLAYRANGGADGRDLLGRYFSVTWVVGIRFLVLVMIPVLSFTLALETYLYGDVPEQTTPLELVVQLTCAAVFYWRVATHLDSLCRMDAV